MGTEDADTLDCEFPACGISIRIQPADARSARHVLTAISGQVYGNRLPRARFVARSELELAAVVGCTLSEPGDQVTLEVSGDIELAPRESDAERVRWDFWKVLSALLPHVLLRRRIVTLHAACLRVDDTTWLVPGESGAGKSTLAFLARARGARVLASELSYVRDGALVAGNCVMSVEREALTAHGVPISGDEALLDGYLVATTAVPERAVAITGVAFPKLVTAAGQRQRVPSAARTRQLLHDNALGQLNSWEVTHAQGGPVGLATPIDKVLDIARETARLAELRVLMVEGTVHEIWARLTTATSTLAPERVSRSSQDLPEDLR